MSALSSVGNLALSIAVARTSDIDELGQFAIAFSLYVLAVGVVRSSVVEPLLAKRPNSSTYRNSLRRASVFGLALAGPMVVVGIVLSLPYIAIMGVAIHGCVVYEYVKTMSLGSFNSLHGLTQETAWFLVSLGGAILTLTGITSALVAFAIWAAGCALIGYGSALALRLRLAPRWDSDLVSNRVAVAFGVDFLIGTGSSQLALNAVSAISGLAVVGALRGAGTILGPVSLVVSSARSLLIPFLSRTIAEKVMSPLAGSLATAAVMAALLAPLLALMALTPTWIGELMLGSNWAYAQPVLPFLLIEMFFIVATTVPFAGHRALLAAKSTLIVRISMAIIRVASIVLAAIAFGAVGAGAAMAATACLGAVVWWWSYAWLLKKHGGSNE